MITDTCDDTYTVDTMETLYSISYPIYFENSLDELVKFVDRGNYSKFFVLTDENTGKHCLPVLKEKFGGARIAEGRACGENHIKRGDQA